MKKSVQPGKWYTFRYVQGWLAEWYNVKISLEETKVLLSLLSMGDNGYIIESEAIGEENGETVYKYRVVGQRDEAAARLERAKRGTNN